MLLRTLFLLLILQNLYPESKLSNTKLCLQLINLRKYILKHSLLDLAEYYNKVITISTRNLLTSLLSASLPPTSLLLTSSLPTFKPLISLLPTTSKKFNPYYTSTSLKRQANRITTQNIQYKIAFKSYVLTILFQYFIY